MTALPSGDGAVAIARMAGMLETSERTWFSWALAYRQIPSARQSYGMDSGTASTARHRRASHFIASGLFSRLMNFGELEGRIADLATPQERGDAFEVFAEAYLATQKINQAAEVWPDGAVPSGVVKSLKLPPKDMGVDGVYLTLGDAYGR